MSLLSPFGPSDFLKALLDLPPPGKAFSGDPATVQASVFTPPGNALSNVHAAAMLLLEQEADPAFTTILLPEWETDWGLPDPCTAASPTVSQRRAALLAKIASQGGQSASYFVSVAAALGFAITISECPPFRLGSTPLGSPLRGPGWQFVWRVHAPSITVSYFRLGSSALGEPFATVSNTELACRLNQIKPAHTVLLFVYS